MESETPEGDYSTNRNLGLLRRLLSIWHISYQEQLRLLALNPDEYDTVSLGLHIEVSPETENRVRLLLGISWYLRHVLVNLDARGRWLQSSNAVFSGRSPLSVMLTGVRGIEHVHAYLAAEAHF